MINSISTTPVLSSNVLPKAQEIKTTQQTASDKVAQDDFSWKYGTPWETTSDEELAKINTRLNNSFKTLVEAYNEAMKDIVVVENSIEQQLAEGRLDKKELEKFISENPLPLVNAFVDKDLISVYKSSASLDEFKAKWLELKNTQSAKLTKMFLEMGFESDLELSNFDYAGKFSSQIDLKA